MTERRLGLFDIDKTSYDGYVIFPLSQHQRQANLIGQPCVDSLVNDLKRYRTEVIDYETLIYDLLVHWAEGLTGVPYHKVLKQTRAFFESSESKFYPFLKPTLDLLKPTHDVYFVTGEPQFVAEAATQLFRLTGFLSSQLEVIDGVFSGRVSSTLARRGEKEQAIGGLLARYPHDGSFAFGDSEGDIEMLGSVAHPICLNPTPGLQSLAVKKDWSIVKPDQVQSTISSILKTG